MAADRWTDEQRSVIKSRGCNLLVSAAAGAGKTAVLVERIFRMITEEPGAVDIDRLLVMTFTNAAAAEMRERIGAKLEEAVGNEPDNRRLLNQQRLLHNASITTIDSFCLGIVRDYFHLLELDPSFRIAEEAELSLMQSDVLAELLEDCYEAAEADFFELVECYGDSKSDRAVGEIILDLYRCASAHPWPEEWLDEMSDNMGAECVSELDAKSWTGFIVQYVKKQLRDAAEMGSTALRYCEMQGGPREYIPVILSELEGIKSVMGCESYSEMNSAAENVSFGRIPGRLKGEIDEDIKERVKALRDGYKDALNTIKKEFFFTDPETICDDMKGAAGPVRALLRLTGEFIRRFSEKKRSRNIIDFNDIEHFALNILITKENGSVRVTQTAEELRERFHEIIIDEYQDSNSLQDCIANAIAGDETKPPFVFTVGDVKQSIYKFRMAKPELFINRMRRYEGDSRYGRSINLHKNFRSRREVLDSTNDVFMLAMNDTVGGVTYDEECSLQAGIPSEPDAEGLYTTELIAVCSDAEKAGASELRGLEARTAAALIRRIVNNPDFLINDRGVKRRAEYGDIVILLRAVSGWSEVFCEVLGQEGIPVSADIQSGFFEAYEIKTMLNYLRILDNARQDIALASVLHSPIGGFDSNEMAELRMAAGPEYSYYDALISYSEKYASGETGQKLTAFLANCEELRRVKRNKDIAALLSEIYDKTGFYVYVSAMPGGERRRANLDKLLDYAAEYESSSYSGLFSFVRYIERLLEYETDYGEAVTEENDNTVRIMSIHKSKGLEFPVVILAGMGKAFNQSDTKAKVVVNPDFGIGPEYVDYKNRTKIPTLLKKAIQKQIRADSLGEELRVLYVAMTRAREKLIMLGGVKDFTKEYESWKEAAGTICAGKLSYSYLMGAKSYFSFVGPAAVTSAKNFKLIQISESEIEEEKKDFESDEEQRRRELEEVEPGNVDDKLISWRKFEYPYSSGNSLPMKLSVSELKKLSMDEEFGEDIFAKKSYSLESEEDAAIKTDRIVPAFLKERAEYSGTDRGTLYHNVMQRMDFSLQDAEAVTAFLEKLVQKGILEARDTEQLNPAKLAAFNRSSVAGRMRAAQAEGRLYREQPFVMGVKACELREEYAGQQEIIPVQGIIDVMFEEADGLVILDYKTDVIKEGNELVRRYKTQLEYYAGAAERLTGKRVKEKLLYSFCLSELVNAE